MNVKWDIELKNDQKTNPVLYYEKNVFKVDYVFDEIKFNKVLEGKGDFGYDAKSDAYVDMLKTGIIDPKKVTRVALENAASVAGMILTTECALIDIKEDAPPMPPMGGGGMPGMM